MQLYLLGGMLTTSDFETYVLETSTSDCDCANSYEKMFCSCGYTFNQKTFSKEDLLTKYNGLKTELTCDRLSIDWGYYSDYDLCCELTSDIKNIDWEFYEKHPNYSQYHLTCNVNANPLRKRLINYKLEELIKCYELLGKETRFYFGMVYPSHRGHKKAWIEAIEKTVNKLKQFNFQKFHKQNESKKWIDEYLD